MALKSKITKAEFDALEDAVKSHYRVNKEDSNIYTLDTDDAAELRAARDAEAELARQQRERADRLQREKDEADERARQAALDKAKKDKDIEALEASWKADKEAAIAAERIKTEHREKQLRDMLVEQKALELAAEISIMPKLLSSVIRARLAAELDGDKPFTRVLDENGQPSAKTLDDLKKEFVDNAEYASIIRGTKASGGGATGNGNSGGGAASKKFSELTEAERVELARSNPEKFREMAKEAGAGFYN